MPAPTPKPYTYQDGHLTLELYWSAKLNRPALRISADCETWDYEDVENVRAVSRELASCRSFQEALEALGAGQ